MKGFNIKLAEARVLVENAIGDWKNRFPVLRSFPGNDPTNIHIRCLALMILQNWLRGLGDTTFTDHPILTDDCIMAHLAEELNRDAGGRYPFDQHHAGHLSDSTMVNGIFIEADRVIANETPASRSRDGWWMRAAILNTNKEMFEAEVVDRRNVRRLNGD